MSALSPEERVERVRMALAEAGCPDAPVRWEWGQVAGSFPPIPKALFWRAKVVAGEQTRCWTCFDSLPFSPEASLAGCGHDPLTSPWPEVVR